jgi:2-aminoadipate transaminase
VGERVPPIHSLAPEHVIYLSTLSKTFSPGLRLGICVAPPEAFRWLVIARQGVDLHTGTLGQALASEYLAGGHLEQRVPQIVEFYRPRREAMLATLERTMPEGVHWTQPEGGMFVWVTGPRGLDADQLYEASLARGVAFVPGRHFYASAAGASSEGTSSDDGAGDGGLPADATSTFRMNFTAAEPAVIERAVEVIAEVMHEMLSRG